MPRGINRMGLWCSEYRELALCTVSGQWTAGKLTNQRTSLDRVVRLLAGQILNYCVFEIAGFHSHHCFEVTSVTSFRAFLRGIAAFVYRFTRMYNNMRSDSKTQMY